MVERFLEYITVEKRYSPHTLTSYRKDLEDFSSFLLQTEAHQDLVNADKKIIRNFMVHLSEKKIAKRSINRKLSSLRSFYLFLLKVGEIKSSPLENIQSLKFYAEKQIPFSEEEMNNHQLVASKPVKKSLLKELIIETLYQTGIRRAELVNLLFQDVDFSKGEFKVTIIDIPEGVAIDLADTGKGIPKSKHKSVFKPGYTTKKRGWGLGLSLCKRIIENYHNGKIFVLHSEENKGTTFRIVLKRG